MSKEFDEENNIFNGNDISFMKPPKDIKVIIWGYELCKGAEWKDFLDVVTKLGKEKADLENELEITKKALELALEDVWAGCGAPNIVKLEINRYKTKAKEMMKSE